jgi:alpha-D-xyloside xylohydrolase
MKGQMEINGCLRGKGFFSFIYVLYVGMALLLLTGVVCSGRAVAEGTSSSNEKPLPVKAVEATEKEQRGPRPIPLRSGTLHLMVCNQNIVRVSIVPNGTFSQRKSLAVVAPCADIPFRVIDSNKQLTLSTDKLKVVVNRAEDKLSFFDQAGKVLLSEASGARTITPATISGEKAFSTKQTFVLSPDEALYGLGQFLDGKLNYRGQDVLLVQENMMIAVPFVVSSHNWGMLWDNYSKTRFHDGPDGMSFSSEVSDGIDYYFITGDSMDEVLSGYRQLTGTAPMLPNWAFGYWQSKERYKSGQELLDVAGEYRRRKIPLDVLVQDWQYWPRGKWSGMEVEKSRYPNLAGLFQSLHQDFHVAVMFSVWPAIGLEAPLHQALKEKGLLLPHPRLLPRSTLGPNPRHNFADLFDPYSLEAWEIYWNYARDGLFNAGLDGWWMDASEPEITAPLLQSNFEWDLKKQGRCALGSFARYLNTYSLVETQGVYEGQRKTTHEKRVVILTRSGFAGQQRYSTIAWSGDTLASF